MGDELRATTIHATGPLPDYQSDTAFHSNIITRFISLLETLTIVPFSITNDFYRPVDLQIRHW